MKLAKGLAVAALAAAAVLSTTGRASAQEEFDVDWRQNDRTDHYRRKELEFPSFVFELRLGGYYPRVDTEPALGGATPFKDIFGSGNKFLLGIELDWVPLRIPYVGGVGPGLGWGWVSASSKAKIDIPGATKGGCLGTLNGCNSADDTTLTIFPMYVVGVLRIDDPMVRYGIPIVPYVKFGVDGAPWTAGTTSPKTYTTPSGKTVSPSGISWGEHLALGAALSLNWLDRDAVNKSREASGVKDFYAFGEWADYAFKTLGSDKQLRVGASAWVIGVSVDF